MSDNFAVSAQCNKNLIVTSDGKKYEKPGFSATTGAVVIANMASGIAMGGISKLGHLPFDKMINNIDKLDKDAFLKAANEAFNVSGLSKKGVELVDAEFANYDVVKDALKEKDSFLLKKLPFLKKFKEQKSAARINNIIDGKDACYAIYKKKIIANKDKMSFALFHEMGHALNYNKSGLGKILTKMKFPFSILTPVAILTAIFKRKKANGEEPQGLFDKATTFIKNNCGKLAFLGMLPVMIEEGLASIKGAKLAKNFLSAENMKTLNSFNSKAWLTYFSLAVASGISAIVASKVRDSIARPKEIDNQN